MAKLPILFLALLTMLTQSDSKSTSQSDNECSPLLRDGNCGIGLTLINGCCYKCTECKLGTVKKSDDCLTECVPCKENYFRSDSSMSECWPCTNCTQAGLYRQFSRKCHKMLNAQCGDCLSGYYEESGNSHSPLEPCHKCLPGSTEPECLHYFALKSPDAGENTVSESDGNVDVTTIWIAVLICVTLILCIALVVCFRTKYYIHLCKKQTKKTECREDAPNCEEIPLNRIAENGSEERDVKENNENDTRQQEIMEQTANENNPEAGGFRNVSRVSDTSQDTDVSPSANHSGHASMNSYGRGNTSQNSSGLENASQSLPGLGRQSQNSPGQGIQSQNSSDQGIQFQNSPGQGSQTQNSSGQGIQSQNSSGWEIQSMNSLGQGSQFQNPSIQEIQSENSPGQEGHQGPSYNTSGNISQNLEGNARAPEGPTSQKGSTQRPDAKERDNYQRAEAGGDIVPSNTNAPCDDQDPGNVLTSVDPPRSIETRYTSNEERTVPVPNLELSPTGSMNVSRDVLGQENATPSRDSVHISDSPSIMPAPSSTPGNNLSSIRIQQPIQTPPKSEDSPDFHNDNLDLSLDISDQQSTGSPSPQQCRREAVETAVKKEPAAARGQSQLLADMNGLSTGAGILREQHADGPSNTRSSSVINIIGPVEINILQSKNLQQTPTQQQNDVDPGHPVQEENLIDASENTEEHDADRPVLDDALSPGQP